MYTRGTCRYGRDFTQELAVYFSYRVRQAAQSAYDSGLHPDFSNKVGACTTHTPTHTRLHVCKQAGTCKHVSRTHAGNLCAGVQAHALTWGPVGCWQACLEVVVVVVAVG